MIPMEEQGWIWCEDCNLCISDFWLFLFCSMENGPEDKRKQMSSLTCAVCLPCQHVDSCSPTLAKSPVTFHNIISGFSRTKIGLISVLPDTWNKQHHLKYKLAEQASWYLCPPYLQTGTHMQPCQEAVSTQAFFDITLCNFHRALFNRALLRWLWACAKPYPCLWSNHFF